MSKTIKNSFLDKLTFKKMLDAHKRSSINKTNKYEVLKFNLDLENNIWNIINSLKDGSYKLGKYREFIIYEPKERIIKCLPYKDRIVHQWYIYEFIKPYIIPRLINDTCACIDNKGTHYAVKKVRKYMRLMKREYDSYYILKLDIKKYFYNIDKSILYNITSEYITDKLLLNLTYKFIYDGKETKGIPIGNYTSQYFANIYIDKYVKYNLGIKYYVRYMDDMVIILKSKEECIDTMNKIKIFLKDILCLELNSKSRHYPSKMGVNFCGYRIYETHILIRNDSKKKIRNKIKYWNKMYELSKLDKLKMKLSLNSWLGHVKHANSYNLVNKYLGNININWY